MKRYGKLLLSAYLMKKIKAGGSQKSKGTMHRYAKLALGAYLLKKLKSEKSHKKVEAEPEEEIESREAGKGSSIMKFGKIILGVLAGATIIYAFKKHAAKKSGHKIEVE